MVDPYISVVIIAHNRMEYLENAVDSVLDQKTDSSIFEIVVVKNFSHTKIDTKLNELGYTNILTDAQSLGDKIILGVQASKGRVISFLEDDDLYVENKIGNVKSAFEKDELLCYYHNAYYTIGEEDAISPRTYRGKTHGSIYISGNPNPKILPVFWSYNPGVNMSCINVLKTTIEPYLDLFHNMNTGTDTLTLFAALSSGNAIKADCDKLTKFRIHNGSSTHNFDSYAIFKDFTREYFREQENALKKMSKVPMSSEVKRQLACFETEIGIGLRLMDKTSLDQSLYETSLQSAKCIPYYKDNFHKFYTILGFLGSIFPRATRFIFFVFWKMYLKNFSM